MSRGAALATVDATSPARPEEEGVVAKTIPSSEPEDLLDAGDRAGDFVIDGVLGHGSFGTVYRAAHAVIGRRAAVKVLRKSAAEAHAIASFIEEARLVARLRHPNIVDVLTFGQLGDGRHFQVMDLIDGPTLADFLRERGPLDLDEALPIARGIASALDAVHRSGITHRDLKPANVVLERRDGELLPKLIDFGIAELSTTEGDPSERSRGLVGTPRYMAPEQCRGEPVDARADSYTFGLLLYEMLTGRPPFAGSDALELMLRHTNDSPEAPSAVRASLPAAVDPIILGLLRKEPAERPIDLTPVVEKLEAIAADRNDGAPVGRPPSRRRWLALAGGGAVAVLGSAVFVLGFGGSRQEPASPATSAAAVNAAPPTSEPITGSPAKSAARPDPVNMTESSSTTQPITAPATSPSQSARPVRRTPAAAAPPSAPGPEDPENPFRR